MFKTKLVVTDIDGVWTDGGMYYDESGNEWKKFNTYDSAGVLWLRIAGIPLAICTGEKMNSVVRRAEKLAIKHVFIGVKDKVAVIEELIDEMGISWQDVAYIGDDLNDLGPFEKAGYTACPSSAPNYIKKRVSYVLRSKGGDGAFREFVEHILGEGFIEKYLNESVEPFKQ